MPSETRKLTGLAQLYAQLDGVNIHLKRRFDALDKKDANFNAIISFLTFSSRTLMSLDEQLAELAPFTIDRNFGGKRAEPPAPGMESNSASPPSDAPDHILVARKKPKASVVSTRRSSDRLALGPTRLVHDIQPE